MFAAQTTAHSDVERLLAAVLRTAAAHDLGCLRADASLRVAFATRSLIPRADTATLLDDCRRALTDLCSALDPVARSRAEDLAPFARLLTESAAIAALDDLGLDAFLRPIFEEAGIADRFVPRSEARAPRGSATIAPSIELVPITLDAEALFDHLLGREEVISYARAYLAMLGPTEGPWRSLRHAPMVLQVARGTAPRAVGAIRVHLDSLIVNKKTRRPGARHFREHPEYSEEAWTGRYGRWSACDHDASDIRAVQHAARPEEPAATTEKTGRIASTALAPVEHPVEVRPPPDGGAVMALPASAVPGSAVPGSAVPASAVPGSALPPIFVPADVDSGPRATTPGLGRAPRLAAAGRSVLGLSLAVIAAIVCGTLVGSAVASHVVPPRISDGEAQVGSGLALSDSFAALPVGSDPGWETSGSGSVRVAPWPTSIDRSVRVRGDAAAQSVSACRTIPPVRDGRLVAEARIFLDGFGGSDTTIASLRSGADEVAGLRIGTGGEILDLGNTAARGGAAAIAPNAWYRAFFDVDIASRTYRLAVLRSDPPTLVSERAGRWARQLDDGVDRFCFTSAGGVAARSVYINELRVNAP